MNRKIIGEEPNKVWATVDATVNMGNYENIKISMGESVSVADSDNAEEVRLDLFSRLLRDTKRAIRRLKETRDAEYIGDPRG